MNKRSLLKGLLLLGLAAQALVPGWMLLKRHLILTRGERVTLAVTLYDPRDLFMGHYVRLALAKDAQLPESLQGIPQRYLRHYCDQRYATLLESGARNESAELDVRVWRGEALAEALRIGGRPAYDYARAAARAAQPQNDLRLYAELPPLPPGLAACAAPLLADALQARGVRILRLPLCEDELWRLTRQRLDLPEPADAPLATPREREARLQPARAWADAWRATGGQLALPLCAGAPFATDAPLDRLADAYYGALEKTRLLRYNDLLVGDPGDADPVALQKTFDLNCREWLIPADSPALQNEEAASNDSILRLCREPPADAGDRPIVRDLGVLPLDDLLALPESPLGRDELRQALDGKRAEPLDRLVCALAREAADRWEATRDPAWADLYDTLLLHTRTRTLHALFEAAPTYADYCAAVRELRDRYPDGTLCPLGGWRQAGRTDPIPRPPRAQTAALPQLRTLAAPLFTP